MHRVGQGRRYGGAEEVLSIDAQEAVERSTDRPPETATEAAARTEKGEATTEADDLRPKAHCPSDMDPEQDRTALLLDPQIRHLGRAVRSDVAGPERALSYLWRPWNRFGTEALPLITTTRRGECGRYFAQDVMWDSDTFGTTLSFLKPPPATFARCEGMTSRGWVGGRGVGSGEGRSDKVWGQDQCPQRSSVGSVIGN